MACKPGKKQALLVVVIDDQDGLDEFRIVESLSTCGLVTKLKKLLPPIIKRFIEQTGDGDYFEDDVDDILSEEPFIGNKVSGFIQVKFLN